MNKIIDGLPGHLNHNGDPVYAASDIKAVASEVISLPGGLLAVCLDQGVVPWVDVALFEFCSSNLDGSNAMYHLVARGGGPGGSLRELRHTYWGDSGYIFYPDAEFCVRPLTP